MVAHEAKTEILLAEDDPNDVELTVDTLKRHHVANRIQVVRDGAEALDYMFCTGRYASRDMNDAPKVVLLDLKLPKVDGIQVLRRIKGDERTQKIPVVVLTSSREAPDIAECYRLGVNSYIVKPVDLQQFSDAVRMLRVYWVLLNEPPE